jgi:mannitol/fructose-specific phosphotransferase system IIA component (Ntr-type)
VNNAAAVSLAAYLDPKRIGFIDAGSNQRDALIVLAEIAGENWLPPQRSAFLTALFDREAVTTTAIGSGIAVPHARLPQLDRCTITLGIAPGGVPWQARDGQAVEIIVLIAAREEAPTEHLRLLATVATLLRDPARRAAILAASSPARVIAALA